MDDSKAWVLGKRSSMSTGSNPDGPRPDPDDYEESPDPDDFGDDDELDDDDEQ